MQTHRTEKMYFSLNPPQYYSKGVLLGKGGFAKCYEARLGDQIYAAKTVSKASVRAQLQVKKEVMILSALDHPNVVKCFRNFEDTNYHYIILELCSNGCLQDLLKQRKVISQPEARYFMYQIAITLNYLRTKGVLHRDVKLGNFLLDEHMNVKIADFGLAAYENEERTNQKCCGTPNYIAPEILMKRPYSYEVDIWSVGVSLYLLLFGRAPFEAKTISETYLLIKNCKYSLETHLEISPEAKHLIKALLSMNPLMRPTPADILVHPFLTMFRIPPKLECKFKSEPPPSSFITQFKQRKAGPDTNDTFQSELKDFQGKDAEYTFTMDINSRAESASLKAKKDMNLGNSLQEGKLNNLVNTMKTPMKTRIMTANKCDKKSPSLHRGNTVGVWENCASMYGLAYMLDDGAVGMLFNDGSKMVAHGRTHHYSRLGQAPSSQENKRRILQSYQLRFQGRRQCVQCAVQAVQAREVVYVDSYVTYRGKNIFSLSNGLVQCIFGDGEQMFICTNPKLLLRGQEQQEEKADLRERMREVSAILQMKR